MFHRVAIAAVMGFAFVSASKAQEQLRTSWLDPGSVNRPEEILEPQTREADLAAHKALNGVLADVKLDDASMSDAIDTLRRMSKAEIFVNWKSLESVGVRRDAPVTLHLRNQKLATVLDVMVLMVGLGHGKLGYTVDQGVITISTQDDLAKNVVVRVYDIRDLLRDSRNEREVRVGAIEKFIMRQIDSHSWKDSGGSVGALRELEGQLIVTQTPENHRRLVALLQDLREMRG